VKKPFYQGSIERIMLGGVPRQYAILLYTIGAAFVLGMYNFYIIPVVFLIHFVLKLLYKRDEYIVEIVLQHMKDSDYLDV
jgi:type IV secretory pathway VirB3-like protein